MKFKFLKDGEWVALQNKFKFRCCDCGLVHSVEYKKIIGSKEVEMRTYRNERATKKARFGMHHKILALAGTIIPDEEAE